MSVKDSKEMPNFDMGIEECLQESDSSSSTDKIMLEIGLDNEADIRVQ